MSTTTPTLAMGYQPLVAWWWSADTAPPMVAADFLRTLHKSHGGMQRTAKRGRQTHAHAMVLDCGVWEHVPDGHRYTGAVVDGRWTADVPPCERFAAMMLVELTPETAAAGTFMERRQFNVADVRKLAALKLDPATGTLVATT